MSSNSGNINPPSGIGLALSGGGYRATLFHLGGILRLNELGLLNQIARVSSVSGGSILSGHLALKWPGLTWDRTNPALPVASNIDSVVTQPVIGYCQLKLDIGNAAIGHILPWTTAAKMLASALDHYCYDGATLQTITAAPEFIFVATNLQTGRPFRMSKAYAYDSRLGSIANPKFRLADAICASAAFPPFFTPFELDTDGQTFVPDAYSDPTLGDDYKQTLQLSDGGVFDNLGLEAIHNSSKVIWVSDAGSPLEPTASFGVFSEQMRVIDIMMAQGLGPRKRDLIQQFKDDARNPGAPGAISGTYWGIGTDITKYGVTGGVAVNPAVIKKLSEAGTQLRPFDHDVQQRLINWGYAVCDAAIRAWYKGPVLQKPPTLPDPAFPLT